MDYGQLNSEGQKVLKSFDQEQIEEYVKIHILRKKKFEKGLDF